MKFLVSAAICAVFTLCSCATTPRPAPIPYVSDASRSDATVLMTSGNLSGLMLLANTPYTFWDWPAAADVAASRCCAWGFDGAEPLAPVVDSCSGRDAFGTCAARRYDRTYQCVGAQANVAGPN